MFRLRIGHGLSIIGKMHENILPLRLEKFIKQNFLKPLNSVEFLEEDKKNVDLV
jgi:hypothetical protein